MKMDEKDIPKRNLHFVEMLVEVDAVKPVIQQDSKSDNTISSVAVKQGHKNGGRIRNPTYWTRTRPGYVQDTLFAYLIFFFFL